MTIAVRPLKRCGLAVSEVGFGAAPLGNLYHRISDAEARDALEAGLAAGMRYVDTAPHYGHGLSERRVGDTVRELDDVVVSTKVGRILRPDASLAGDGERQGFRSSLPFEGVFDYTYDGVLRSYEDSLQRLGLAKIDLLFVHDIGVATHGADHGRTFDQLTTGGGLRALEELRREGTIAGFGLGVNEWQVCMDVMEQVDLDVVLLAGRYTLLEQGALERFLPQCLERDVSVVIGGVYNSGILATGTRTREPLYYNYEQAPAGIVERVRRLEALCDRFAVRLPAAALQFALAHPAVVSVIPGLADAGRVAETVDLYRSVIPAEFWQTLRAEHLVDAAAPLPLAGV